MAEGTDLAIVGSGPTGLSAAIYSTREDIKTVIYDAKIVGGLVVVTDLIDNYPGFPDGVTGQDLSAAMEKQARRFGAHIETGQPVTSIAAEGDSIKLTTPSGEHAARAVLIATGSDYRKLGIPGEREFSGKGVSYCATCDGPFFRGQELVVVGGGNSAMQESIFLTKFATKITMLVRGSKLKGSEILIKEIQAHEQIQVCYNITATSITSAEGRVTGVEAVNSLTGKPAEFKAAGVFVFIGLVPNTQWLENSGVKLDEYGFILTDNKFMTAVPGVYAAGDVRSGSTLQIASAVGEGVTAALMIREYLKTAG